MKILLPVHHFPPKFSAGAELYSYRLAQWLRQQGHQVEVACIESISEGVSDHVAVQQDVFNNIPVWRLSFNIFEAPERQRWDFDNPLLGDWFSEYALLHEPDIVHFHAGYLLGSAPLRSIARLQIPSVLTLHDYWFLCPRHTLLRSNGQLCHKVPDDPRTCAWCRKAEDTRYLKADQISGGAVGWALRTFDLQEASVLQTERRERVISALQLVDAVIAPSNFLATLYKPYVHPERLHMIRYGLDTTAFEYLSPIPSQALRIGFIGQIAEHKGVHILIDAFRRLQSKTQPLELHIYGGLEVNPDYVRKLRQLAQNDTRIYFHGRFQNTEVANILAALDVLVVPSIWFENSPLTISEGQAAKVPVVTSRLGGMAEMVHHDIDGLLFNAGDVRNLQHTLQRCIDEPELLQRFRAAISVPQSIDQEMKQIGEIYSTLLAHKQLSTYAN